MVWIASNNVNAIVISAATMTSGLGPAQRERYPTRPQPKMQIVAIESGSERMSIGIPGLVERFFRVSPGRTRQQQ